MQSKDPLVAMVMGDGAGVGPELVIQAAVKSMAPYLMDLASASPESR